MKRYRQIIGAKGEKLALRFLQREGYKIIRKNFSCFFGEIDIIACQEDVTVFVEVKTRSSCEYGLPEESIKTEKIKHLVRSAQFYIKKYAHPDGEFRFDIVSIVLSAPARIDLIKNAF